MAPKALMVVINWSGENATADITSVAPDFPDTGIVEASTLRKEREACTLRKVLQCVLKVSLAHVCGQNGRWNTGLPTYSDTFGNSKNKTLTVSVCHSIR